MIFTFYSFKGGVGRSMLLANVAEYLYRRGLNVLMVDFDLEAPGLDRYFSSSSNFKSETVQRGAPDHQDLLQSRGILDLLISYKALRAIPPPAIDPPAISDNTETSPTVKATKAPFPYQVEPLKNFVVPICSPPESGGELESVDAPLSSRPEGSLWLMPAGRRDEGEYALYADRVRAFDWDDFYSNWNGAQFFDWFGEELRKSYDVVLIDSRTGITEMAGVCTHVLADSVVLFVAANEQNLDGTRRMAMSLSRKELAERRQGNKVSILIVPSRVELNEGLKLNEFSKMFETLIPWIDTRIPSDANAFLNLRVPYVPFYAFGERVAVREPDLPIAADLIAATRRICSAMFELVPKESEAFIRFQAAQAKLPNAALPVTFEKPPSDFAGRDWAFAAISTWLRQSSPSTMLIVGGPGCGKTAIAASLVEAMAGAVGAPRGSLGLSGQLLVAYSCEKGADWRLFVQILVRALAARWPQFAAAVRRTASNVPAITVRVQQRIATVRGPESAHDLSIDSVSIGNVSPQQAFNALLSTPLQDIAKSVGSSDDSAGPSLILVDALDADSSAEGDSLGDLLTLIVTSGLPLPALRLMILSRPDPRLPLMNPATVLKLDADESRARQDVAAYAEMRLANRLPQTERRMIVEQITRAATGNFLYARTVTDALLANAEEPKAILANADQSLHPDRIPAGLQSAYARFIQQTVGLNLDRWAERYRPIAGLLAVAPEGLTVNQLAGALRRPRSEISDSLRALSNLLSGPSTTGRYQLFHKSFGTFVLADTSYGTSAAEAHEEIADYFFDQYSDAWVSASPPEAVRYTDFHFMQAIRATDDRRKQQDLLEKLAALVLQAKFVEAKLGLDLQEEFGGAIRAVFDLLPPQDTRRATLDALALVVHEPSTIAQIRRDPKWLREELVRRVGDPVASPESEPSGAESAAAATATPAQSRRNLTVRSQIPLSVQIRLKVAERANHIGQVLLTLGGALALFLLGGVMWRQMFYYFSENIGDGFWLSVFSAVIFAAGYLFYVLWSDRNPPPEDPYEAKILEGEAEWQKLPEVVALSSHRRPYRLLGGVAIASPYFEITVIILIFISVVAAVFFGQRLLRF